MTLSIGLNISPMFNLGFELPISIVKLHFECMFIYIKAHLVFTSVYIFVVRQDLIEFNGIQNGICYYLTEIH